MYVGRGPPENCFGSGAPVQRTGGTGGSYGPAKEPSKWGLPLGLTF